MLFLLSCGAFFAGGAILIAAQSAIHEIEAFVLFLIAAVLLGAATIVEAVARQSKERAEDAKAGAKSLAEVIAAIRLLVPQPPSLMPAMPAPDGVRYFVNSDGNTSGPFPVSQLRALKTRGVIDDNTPVAKEGGDSWAKLRDVLDSR